MKSGSATWGLSRCAGRRVRPNGALVNNGFRARLAFLLFSCTPVLASLRLSIRNGRLWPLAPRSLAHWAHSRLHPALRAAGNRPPLFAETGKVWWRASPATYWGLRAPNPGGASMLCQSDPVGCRAEPCSVWAKPTSIYLPPSPRRAEKGGRGGRGGTQRNIQRCMSAGET